MSSIGRVLLVSTALAPVLVVYGAAVFFEKRELAVALLIVSGLLAVLCHLLLVYISRHGTRENLEIEEVAGKDSDILAFLVAYMLPIALTSQFEVNPLAFVAFLTMMGLVFFRTDVYHVNPLLGIFGYHFYEIKSKAKVTHLVVTRRKTPLTPGTLNYRRLSRSLLLEKA